MGCIGISRGFMGRLARDVRGNTIALMAAAMMPLAGLIGGGVDMSRLYLTKTRLQQACDAGVLAGRKAMAAGSWTAGVNNGSTNDKAEKMFGANFGSGQYGTNTLTKEFTENSGTVNGSASVRVPMTIMRVFGMQQRTLRVVCTAKMELPNTDVMLVLDVTKSMQCLPAANSDSCSTAPAGSQRIDSLKKAVRCFYEALEKVATPEPCTVDLHDVNNPNDDTYNSTGDPTATAATTTAQVRIGFVPYGVNVNVGKILPNAMMADNWTYQTREPILNPWVWTADAPGTPTGWGNWTGNVPSDLNDQSKYSNWNNDLPSSPATITIAGYNGSATLTVRPSDGQTNCLARNNIGPNNNKLVNYADTASPQTPTQTAATTPVHPDTTQTITYSQTENHSVIAYKYVWTSNSCRLRQSSNARTYTRTHTGGQATRTLTWTQPAPTAIAGWKYLSKSLPVGALKAGNSSWNTNLTVASIGSTKSGNNVTPSGSTTAQKLQYPADVTISWDGCIEEAATFQNIDTNPLDDWATIPADARDMNINLIPNSPSVAPSWTNNTTFSPGTYWGPMLAETSGNATINGVVWARYPQGSGAGEANWSLNPVTYNPYVSEMDQDNFTYVCTASPARKLAEYRTAGTNGDTSTFLGYVNALSATDLGTYHDIGLLWGARLLSPTGIFAADNATAATGGLIRRHLIFMTDGQTNTVHANYNAYGLSFYNRYQFNADPTKTQTDNLTNARLIALCESIKNMNITLWVVSFGASIDQTTRTRLSNCTTEPHDEHFFESATTAGLTTQFQTIAAKISDLRLTS